MIEQITNLSPTEFLLYGVFGVIGIVVLFIAGIYFLRNKKPKTTIRTMGTSIEEAYTHLDAASEILRDLHKEIKLIEKKLK